MVTGMAAWFGLAWLLDAALRRREALGPSRRLATVGALHDAAGLGGGAPGETPPPIAFGRRPDDEPSDEELVARVRAQVDIPPGVEVTAVEGAVVLFGRVPRFAFAQLLSRVARVPGVVDVEDRLTPVDDVGAIEHP